LLIGWSNKEKKMNEERPAENYLTKEEFNNFASIINKEIEQLFEIVSMLNNKIEKLNKGLSRENLQEHIKKQ